MTRAVSLESRLPGLFEAVDAKDTDAFLGYLTRDARFRFGSAPELRGHDAIRGGVDTFFASIDGSSHALKNVLGNERTLVCEGEVSYTRHDRSKVSLPFVNVFDLEGEQIANYRIYIDIAPLHADP